MATEPISDGGDSVAFDNLTPAQRLKEKHNLDTVHPVTLEEVVDEEDMAHPPPSEAPVREPQHQPILASAEEPVLETTTKKPVGNPEFDARFKARGQATNASLDTKSEEAFPALGGGLKSQASNPLSMAWGSKKQGTVGHSYANGHNGNGLSSNNASSRTSTPASAVSDSDPANALASSQARGLPVSRMPLPGKHTERIQFSPSQLLPRDQLKKPVTDVIRSINKKSKATVQFKLGPNGTIFFEAIGPPEATRQALIDVAREVGSKQSVKIPIPKNVRAHIIGRNGAVVQRISKQTGARIQIPKSEDITHHEEDGDDSSTIDVVIEGDAVSAESARREIEAIVNERTSVVNMRLKDVPPEFFPFIAGPHGSGTSALENGRQIKVQIPHYYTWSQQPPSQPSSSGMVPQFVPDPKNQIRISGDRLAVQEARNEIEQQVELLRRKITLSQFPINRGQHQFIIGESGNLLHDLLEETGCAVILPPTTDNTEMLSITGPHDKIELGIEKVMSLATSMQMSSVDVARLHINSPVGSHAHARALTRYLQQREAIAQLERRYEARIVLPNNSESPVQWEIYSRDGKNTIRARSDIMNLISAYPPARIRHMPADPFFHQHLKSQEAQLVRDKFGVHILFPDPNERTSEIILICEEPTDGHEGSYELPKQRPTSSDFLEFEKTLSKAQEHIESLIQGQEEIGSATAVVPQKFSEKVRKLVNRIQQDLPSTTLPVQIVSTSMNSTNGSTLTQENSIGAPSLVQEVILRGPRTAAEDLAKRILLFVQDESRDEVERGHITSFEFPAKYANYLIGRKGENINKYREEFDVEIQVSDGKVEIKGPKAKAELAKAKILLLRKRLDDEAIHVLKIKPQYHRDLIGGQGNQVNRLEQRYNVRIHFPRGAQNISDDKSVMDGGSDIGGLKNGRSSQLSDEVVIRGPKKGADEAREEILNLLQWNIDNSHTSIVSVAQRQLPSLIGQSGREMEQLRLSTGAQIEVPSASRDVLTQADRVEILIKGTKKSVEDAKKQLEQRAKSFDDTAVKTIDVDRKHYKALIGSGGSNIRSIVLDAGGPDNPRGLARTVRFPPQESPENTIRIEGNKDVVDKIITAIQAFVNQKDNQTTRFLEVAPEMHRLLIGQSGETRKSLESEFKVGIDIPRSSQQGPGRSQVKIFGQPEDIERAKIRISELLKGQGGKTIQVPRSVHHIISNNGQLFRHLRKDLNVTVDHAGQHPPPKPVTANRSQFSSNGSLPLIIDDQSLTKNHMWEIIDNNRQGTEKGDIPWILRGSVDDVAKAQSILENAITQAQEQEPSFIGYLVLPDTRTYRFVIGQGGTQINSIRKQTGCKITVPRDHSKEEAIEISGTRAGVENAKDIILEVVKNAHHGGVNGSGSGARQ